MDSHDKNTINNDAWEWQDEEYYCLQRDSGTDFSRSLWDNVSVNEDDLMCILDEHTPIKDCVDLTYQVYDVGELNSNDADKEFEECAETLRIKRRRMLQFTSDKVGDQMDGLPETLESNPQWTTGFQDDRCNFPIDGWDRSSEGWSANYLNESEMHCSVNEMPDYMTTDDQVDVPVFNIAPEIETDDAVVGEIPRPSPIKIIRGKNSFLDSPMKLATSVAYPFALVKPCGVEGDVTLKDINQRIHAPPPSISEQKMDEDPSVSYPTSAFSGKPVLVKTKIRTQGGKGSITIMRTKGCITKTCFQT